ncbi:hypothetical protein DICSQDRAFT_159041 [Dichomitus squalens LYAD-421 SS1]|uniref:uncharacterized protein n=1 Tax=Dichomitus squalens (strain LYAD-421) TaxID=732165 RepID=UPI00044109C2|nr:uncharacterized protein DICSQDRAFT_159041 [Dichomitus squalens LYAD-421 SS1]EJF65930.1 hypothetical protein DICSQDRAFT_159041 [Dichomitus squalens LYAD-421 SS1]
MAGFPAPPLKDWERADKLNVEFVGYGWEGKRVIVRFHLPKDRNNERVQLALLYMGRDMKHSKNWACEFCGKPSRETHVEMLSWQHLDPPRLVLYIHFVCDIDEPHVMQGLTSCHNMLNTMHMGQLGPMPDRLERQPGAVYALAGSCACCERDETAANAQTLKKCSKCKLTRFHSLECQKKDWPRHKVTCSQIYSVTFENWE